MVRTITTALFLSLSAPALSASVDLRDQAGERVLNDILDDRSFWSGATTSHHTDQLFDEIRLKHTADGYVPMITGEGDQDYARDLVSDVVFFENERLPRHMTGAKAIVPLGSGTDPTLGLPYRDTFYVLDMTVMYVVFPQRMYRQHDPKTGQTVLAFEKLDASFVSPASWRAYEHKMTQTVKGMSRRVIMNSVVEADSVYGMFIVEPGETRESRVTFISKIGFDDNGGWMARMGSRLPPVLRSGLKSGFNASVRIAREEKKRRG